MRKNRTKSVDDGEESSQAKNDVFDEGSKGGKEVLTLAVALRHLASYRIPRPPPLPKTFLEPYFWIQLVPPANRSPQLLHSLLAEDA